MERDGRYNHIEDVLAHLHTGQWFTFTDADNKTYEDIIILDDTKDKPTEKSLTDALAKQQSDFDSQAYVRDRAKTFPSWQEQMDMQYHDQLNGTTTWKDAVAKVKSDNPKS